MIITSNIFNIALSGMGAAQTRVQVSGHNIANLETQGFVRQEVTQSDIAGNAGTIATVDKSKSGSGTSLETDLVYQLKAKNDFMANLSVLKVSDSMLGSLLDEKT